MLRTPPYKAPITGPGVWRGSDFSSPADYWYYLSRETLAELDRALQQIHAAGKPIFSLTVQDFPLPSFENDAEALREELRTGSGFVVVKGLPIDRYTQDEACMIYWGLGTHLGRPIPQKVEGGLLYSVRDEGYNLERDYGAAGVRTSKTTAGFNYHTDSPSMLAGGEVRRRIGHHKRLYGAQRDPGGAAGVSRPSVRPLSHGSARGTAAGRAAHAACAGVCLRWTARGAVLALLHHQGRRSRGRPADG